MHDIIKPVLNQSNYKDVLSARKRVQMRRELRLRGFPIRMLSKLNEVELEQLYKVYNRKINK